LAFDTGFAVLVLGVAVWTIAARDTFAAVVGFVTYGLLLALVWLRLAAPDVALTEAAIGSGVTGGLLLGASIRLRRTGTATAGERPGATLRLAAAVLCTFVSAGLAAIVLLLALLGIWSLAPDRVWGGFPGPGHDADPHGVLSFAAQLLVPVGILVGIHIFWVGSVAPGGEFQGATILAAMWILTMMAGLVDAPPASRRWLRILLVAGPAVFFVIGLAGFAMAGAFLAYPAPYAKLLILVIEIPVTLSIAVTLALLVAGPPERAPQQ
jgi:uncharacterized MnhB-related membrane protein